MVVVTSMQSVSDEEIMKQLEPSKIESWTEELRGFAPKSNKQMQLYVRDFPEKYEVFKEILQLFEIFSEQASEERIVNKIREKQKELGGRLNFNLAKLAGIKQYVRFHKQIFTE